MKKALLVLTILLATTALFAAGKPDLVAKVERGELKEARASWWGFDPADSTAALQAAIDSGAPKLIVDNVGQTWITRPLFAASNQEIVFEKGVVVEAKKGEFKGGNDSLLTVRERENVTLIGYGAVLRMRRADYDDPKQYKKAEWRMVLNILSSKNIKVYGLTLALSGGDGIYLGVSKRGVTNRNIHIKDVICDRNYRQGISVISARDLLIENTVMRDTRGTPPMAGIDFEPNHAGEELVNCVMRNCVSENNAGYGYVLYVPTLRAESAPLSIRLENCISRGNSSDFGLSTGNSEADAVGGSVEVVKCRFERSRGVSISIRNKPVAGARVRFQDCVIDTPAAEKPELPPISITASARCRRAVGGVKFGRLRVIDPVERPVFDYYAWFSPGGVKTITGLITIQRKGVETAYRLPEDWLKEHPEAQSIKPIPPLSLKGMALAPAAGGAAAAAKAGGAPFFLRQAGTLAFYAKAGDEVSFTLEHAQVGNYSGKTLRIEAIAPSGKKVPVGQLPFKTRKELRFRAPATGVYLLPIKAGANRVGLVASSKPMAVSGVDGPIHFIGPAGEFYFLVPAGTRKFGLIFYGEGRGEAVKATVYNAAGKQVWQKDRITLPIMYASETEPPASDQVWRVRLERPTGITCEDNYVDMRGVPPFLARDPRGLLKPRKKK
ncbi:MAG: right-handed parallel beta-helix repeat-containing protein [Kiritimatiellaeota bacterium]|nr:right-handed parallel beta-helix repeat-containing protein [Kiritimatiellota bacterium]